MKFHIYLKIKSVGADIRNFIGLMVNIRFWYARVDRHLDQAGRLNSHGHLSRHVLFELLIENGLSLKIL